MSHDALAWTPILLLGLGHGINPAMGWLLAAALGMQEGRGRAVWRALVPLAAGHAAAIGLAVGAAVAIGTALPANTIRWGVACLLFLVGCYRLVRSTHPSLGGFRVTMREMFVWSLVMATGHGAGLMVLPFLPGGPTQAPAMQHAIPHAGLSGSAGALATVLHAAGYLAATGLIAFLVYRYLGVRWLKTLWINLDLVWSVALIVTAVATVAWI